MSGPVVGVPCVTIMTDLPTPMLLALPLPCQVPLIDIKFTMVRGKPPILPLFTLLSSVPRPRARGGQERLCVILLQPRVPVAEDTVSRIHPLVRILITLVLNVVDNRLLDLDLRRPPNHLYQLHQVGARGGQERLCAILFQPRVSRPAEQIKRIGTRTSMRVSVSNVRS